MAPVRLNQNSRTTARNGTASGTTLVAVRDEVWHATGKGHHRSEILRCEAIWTEGSRAHFNHLLHPTVVLAAEWTLDRIVSPPSSYHPGNQSGFLDGSVCSETSMGGLARSGTREGDETLTLP